MAHDVFISYSSKDKVIADALCHAIEQEGIRCWIAPRDVIAGHNYASDLTEGIENCTCFILVFSKNSNESPHVMNELTLAFNFQKTILPFKINNVKMNKSLEYFLSGKHWIDAFPNPAEYYFGEIINTLKNYLSNSPGYIQRKRKDEAERVKQSQNAELKATDSGISPVNIEKGTGELKSGYISDYQTNNQKTKPKKPKKNIKKLYIVLTLICICLIVVLAWNTNRNNATKIFFDDFSSYSVNTYPTQFKVKYEGTGTANQKVIMTKQASKGEGNVFRLQGASGWASNQLVSCLQSDLKKVTKLIVEADVKPISGSTSGAICLYNESVDTWGTCISSVSFSKGIISTMKYGANGLEIGTYENGKWYHVKMVHDLKDRTYEVYIDNDLKGSKLEMHPTVPFSSLSLAAGNSGQDEIYYDNVKIEVTLA